jgi:hypothetical protein
MRVCEVEYFQRPRPFRPRGAFRPGVSMIGHSVTLPLLHCAAIISSTILSFIKVRDFAPAFAQLLRQRFD